MRPLAAALVAALLVTAAGAEDADGLADAIRVRIAAEVALLGLQEPAPTPLPKIIIPPVPPKPPTVAPKPLPKAVQVIKTVSVAVPRGDHVHRCACGNEFSHHTGTPGHTCPACGRTVTVINRYGPTTLSRRVTETVLVPDLPQSPSPPAPRAVPFSALPRSGPDCPT